jgi:hypothetical protein
MKMKGVFNRQNTEGFDDGELEILNRTYQDVMKKYPGKEDVKTLTDYVKEGILSNCEYYLRIGKTGDE